MRDAAHPDAAAAILQLCARPADRWCRLHQSHLAMESADVSAADELAERAQVTADAGTADC
jgi:hypothetical protein